MCLTTIALVTAIVHQQPIGVCPLMKHTLHILAATTPPMFELIVGGFDDET
jgi:hypothetical protein